MSKPSPRRAERRKKKQRKRNARERPHLAKKEMLTSFPEILYDGTASRWLMIEVERAIKDIILDHQRLLPPGVSDAFRRAKVEGFGAVLKDIRVAHETAATLGVPIEKRPISRDQFELALGELLFTRLPSSVWDNHFPFEDVLIFLAEPRRNTILVRFRELEHAKTSGGTAHHSPFRPTVEVHGVSRIVAFYRHAAERICSRCVVDWKTYGGLGDAFAVLNDCVYFEPWIHARGEPGIAVFRECIRGYTTASYAKEILGKEPTRKSSYYYRIGYCPGVEESGFLIAKTLLLPGMRGTPEAVWAKKNLTKEENRQLVERADELGYGKLDKSDDFSLLKRFHDGGIKQVVTMDRKVFRHPRTGRTVGRRHASPQERQGEP